jgi:hypothetical protein
VKALAAPAPTTIMAATAGPAQIARNAIFLPNRT